MNVLIDADLHVLGVWNMVGVGGKVVAIDADLVRVCLDKNGYREETTCLDTAVSVILFIEPLVVLESVAGHMVIINIHGQPQGDGVCGICTIVFGDEVDVERARNWGFSIDVHDLSGPEVKELSTGSRLRLLCPHSCKNKRNSNYWHHN